MEIEEILKKFRAITESEDKCTKSKDNKFCPVHGFGGCPAMNEDDTENDTEEDTSDEDTEENTPVKDIKKDDTTKVTTVPKDVKNNTTNESNINVFAFGATT